MTDNWCNSKENMKYIHNTLKKKFILGINSNRSIVMTKDDKLEGHYQCTEFSIPVKAYLKEIDFGV